MTPKTFPLTGHPSERYWRNFDLFWCQMGIRTFESPGAKAPCLCIPRGAPALTARPLLAIPQSAGARERYTNLRVARDPTKANTRGHSRVLDKVVSRFEWTGTDKVEFLAFPQQTGRAFPTLGLMTQLGAFSSSPRP